MLRYGFSRLFIPAFLDGKWLAKFRKKLDATPPRGFSEISWPEKIGRLALCAIAAGAFLIPLIWFVSK
jgi:hypothetical protein